MEKLKEERISRKSKLLLNAHREAKYVIGVDSGGRGVIVEPNKVGFIRGMGLGAKL